MTLSKLLGFLSLAILAYITYWSYTNTPCTPGDELRHLFCAFVTGVIFAYIPMLFSSLLKGSNQ